MIFEVRQVDVHQPIQCVEGVHAFIATAVPNHGYGQARLDSFQKGGEGKRIVCGCDKIDVGRAHFHERKNGLLQFGFGHFFSLLSAADGAILAVDTAKVTATEKDRSRTTLTAKAGLLKGVKGNARDKKFARCATIAEAVFAVDAAAARTYLASIHPSYSPFFQILIYRCVFVGWGYGRF